MSNGICGNGNGDGYYSADCTDPTLQDPACQNHCGGLVGSQITYNSTSGLWACCTYNGGTPDCSEPSDELFAAPGPSSLKTVLHLPTTGSVTYSTPTATATSIGNAHTSSASSSASPSSPSSSPSSSIGPGAAAGIGVGAGAGLILIAAVVAFVIFKRRRPMKTDTAMSADAGFHQSLEPHELDNKSMMPEMDNGLALSELPSNSLRGPGSHPYVS
ncbi:uncharacterized protein N7498_008119 [Penicillium cinerascens]|uniref:Uncharacterized protein n=1 Tax=Penicillium cinerascens TaxID=70096 RepID=A0A9W9M9D9_9EURO|nr:uncharacterized protein N7498_008119 [Penicillium cinerascens]KAJ5194681.1 hypothetical protein N7498_008119 [Penicillium cinerascens]